MSLQSYGADITLIQSVLRDKESELMRLRNENSALKQIERRHNKDFKQLEWQAEDSVLQSLREELAGLKHKLKLYFTQLSANAREIRHISDDRRRLKDQNTRLEKLIADRHLAEREELAKESEHLLQQLAEQQKICSDAVKRADLIDKNLNADNRHLRARVCTLEKDNSRHSLKVKELEEMLKEKEKELASLYIYRHHAIHKRVDTVASKEPRDGLDSARYVLPSLPIIKQIDDTTVEVILSIPSDFDQSGPKSVEKKSIAIHYSQSAGMAHSKHHVEPLDASKTPHRTITIKHLERNCEYFFQAHLHSGKTIVPIAAVQNVQLLEVPSQKSEDPEICNFVPSPPIPRVQKGTVVIIEKLPGRVHSKNVEKARFLGVRLSTKEQHHDIKTIRFEFDREGNDSANDWEYVMNSLDAGYEYLFQVQFYCDKQWSQVSGLSTPVVLPVTRPPQQPSVAPKPAPAAPTENTKAPSSAPVTTPKEERAPHVPPQTPPSDIAAQSDLTAEANPVPPANTEPITKDDPQEETQPEEPDSGAQSLQLSKSRTTSNVSLDQRIENMHKGHPAYYEPTPS